MGGVGDDDRLWHGFWRRRNDPDAGDRRPRGVRIGEIHSEINVRS